MNRPSFKIGPGSFKISKLEAQVISNLLESNLFAIKSFLIQQKSFNLALHRPHFLYLAEVLSPTNRAIVSMSKISGELRMEKMYRLSWERALYWEFHALINRLEKQIST
jgi:hypothetical protein